MLGVNQLPLLLRLWLRLACILMQNSHVIASHTQSCTCFTLPRTALKDALAIILTITSKSFPSSPPPVPFSPPEV